LQDSNILCNGINVIIILQNHIVIVIFHQLRIRLINSTIHIYF